MVGITVATIREPSANRNYFHVQFVVTDVIANLLEAAHDWEVSDGIGEDYFARERKPGAIPVMFCSATPALR